MATSLSSPTPGGADSTLAASGGPAAASADQTTTPPIAANGFVSIPENTTVTIAGTQIAANASTPIVNDPLHVAAITQGQDGTAVLNGGTVTFTPAAGFTGHASFGYTVADALGLTSNPATITVNVAPAVPTVSTSPLTFQVPFGQPLSFNADQILGGVYSPVNLFGTEVLTPGLTVFNGMHGSVSLDPQTGQITFVADPGFVGTASFQWIVNYVHPGQPTTIDVQVAPPPPAVVNDTVTATENIALVLPASQLPANDYASAPNDTLHIAAVSGAESAGVIFADDAINGRQLFLVTGDTAPVEQVVSPGANGAFPPVAFHDSHITFPVDIMPTPHEIPLLV